MQMSYYYLNHTFFHVFSNDVCVHSCAHILAEQCLQRGRALTGFGLALCHSVWPLRVCDLTWIFFFMPLPVLLALSDKQAC